VTRQLGYDLDNFRAALGWVLESREAELGLRLAGALRDFWRLGGHLREGERWLEDVLALPGAAGATLPRARALTAAADVSGWTGEREAYLRLAEEAVAIYRELGDAAGIPDALGELGAAQLGAGQTEAARATLKEARELNIARGNRQKAGEDTLALGMVALVEGKPDEARQLLELALRTFRDLRDMYWISFAERIAGQAERIAGNFEAAEARYRASLLTSQENELLFVTATVLYGYADVALARGQHQRAVRLAGASDALRERLGDLRSFEAELFGDVRTAARSFLDEAAAERLYQEGRAMELEDAVAYALKQPGA
jgi:tetratricopeptide (TPR) repeat protein